MNVDLSKVKFSVPKESLHFGQALPGYNFQRQDLKCEIRLSHAHLDGVVPEYHVGCEDKRHQDNEGSEEALVLVD